MKLEMYVGVVSLFSPCDYVDFFLLLLECFKYSKMLMNIIRLRALKCFHISTQPEMSSKKKNNRLRKRDDGIKAGILDSVCCSSILLLTLVKLP